MPNWCMCKLRVSGNLSDLNMFRHVASGKNGALDFDSFIPYPEKWRILDEEYLEKQSNGESTVGVKDGFNNGGYEWCLKHWGTKWNANMSYIKLKARSILYRFETAWTPPIPIMFKMSEMFKRLSFIIEYNEPGCDVKGKIKFREGRVVYGEY